MNKLNAHKFQAFDEAFEFTLGDFFSMPILAWLDLQLLWCWHLPTFVSGILPFLFLGRNTRVIPCNMKKSLEEFIVVILYFQHAADDVKKIELHRMTCGSNFLSMLNLHLTMTSHGHCILLSGGVGVGWGLQCLETSWLQFQMFPSCLF